MDVIIGKEMQLAELLGWKDIQLGGRYDGTNIPDKWVLGIRPGSRTKEHELTPMWGRNGEACLDLIIEHEVTLQYSQDEFVFAHSKFNYATHAYYAQHASKAIAVKYAVIEVVIKKLLQESKM